MKFDIYASMNSTRQVGGDFYDFYLIGDDCTPYTGKVAFVIADVTGKGVPAALFMMKAKAQYQLDVAIGELFVNVCKYAYVDAAPDVPRVVRVQRTYTADPPSINVDIIDGGVAFDPLAKPDAVTPREIENVPIGGLGILLAKKCTDDIRYERTADSNIVTVVKKW